MNEWRDGRRRARRIAALARSLTPKAAFFHTSEGGIVGMSEQTTLGVGDRAPSFTLRTVGLKEVSLSDYAGKNVVLLFYPLDWTPG